MYQSLSFNKLLTATLFAIPLTSAHLAAYTPGMYCPENAYQGPHKNATDLRSETGHVAAVYDPLHNHDFDSWFLSKGRNCLLAEPFGIWEIEANSVISVPWATKYNSTGFYADGKEQNERPIPFSATNPEVVAQGLVSSSGGISSPNMHAANKSTAAGTAIAISYVSNVYDVTMDNLVVISIAPETPFERLANYTIPDLAPCDECICVTGWAPKGFGEQNMYMTAHKCKIINPKSGRIPKTPSLVPRPGVIGPKQMIGAFQKTGNNILYTRGDMIPTYSTSMGYMNGAQTDIFGDDAKNPVPPPVSSSTKPLSSSSTFSTKSSTYSINTFSTIVRVPTTQTANIAHPTTTVAPVLKTFTTIISTLVTLTITSVTPADATPIPGCNS
ncbi:hypothetical protein F5884DRAFT_899744 [Xylogone sp. PMI_703]|nr:hypothetical protein F5884DRAFT_899744 [Xylogone sp. PMI_703]